MLQDSEGGNRFGLAVVLLVASLLVGLGGLAYFLQRAASTRAVLAQKAAEQERLLASRAQAEEVRDRARTVASLPTESALPSSEVPGDNTGPVDAGELRVIPGERCTTIVKGEEWLFVQELGNGGTAFVFGLGLPAPALPEADPEGTSPRIAVMPGVRKLLPLSAEHTLHLLAGNSSIDLSDRDRPQEHDSALLDLLRGSHDLGAVLATLTQVAHWNELVR